MTVTHLKKVRHASIRNNWRKDYVMEIETDKVQIRIQKRTEGEIIGRLLFLGFWVYLGLMAIFIFSMLT